MMAIEPKRTLEANAAGVFLDSYIAGTVSNMI